MLAAAIGHLGHFYLREERNISTAWQLLTSAKEHAIGCQPLQGWCTLVMASIAAHEGNHQKCEALIAEALESVSQISQPAQELDPYFTDFNIMSVNAFAGNCWLTLGQPKQAYQFLTPTNIESLSINRQASAYYDLTRAHTTRGELEEAQWAAFRSIDLALATENEYIIPRFFSLAKSMQQIYPKTPCATVIAEYAQQALLTKERTIVS